MKEFALTEDHLKLLRNAYIGWDGCEFGAPAMDCKRPYGNSDVVGDIGRILGWKPPTNEYDDTEWSESQEAMATQIHKELQTALQICVLYAGKALRPGVYRQEEEYHYDSWQWVRPSPCQG